MRLLHPGGQLRIEAHEGSVSERDAVAAAQECREWRSGCLSETRRHVRCHSDTVVVEG
jgi:hypothetical protein